MRKRPRQTEVAALANVSPAIVSLVINGRVHGNVRISQEAQQRVWDAVRELGYVVNPVARKLAGNQSRMLGVFTYQAIFPLEYHDFYYPFLIGIEEEAQAQDYDLLLFTRPAAHGGRAIYKEGVNSLQVADGAILLGVYEGPDEIAHLLQDGFPFVYVGKREIPGGEIPYVAADYTEATAQVVAYMYSLGHRRILHLFDRNGVQREAHRDRQDGYILAHQRLGMPCDEQLLVGCEPSQITRDLVQHYFSSGVTALVIEDISHLHKFLDSATELGIQMPRDISYALLGDPLNETQRLVDVTGFSIPRYEMGREAVRLLIDLLAEENSSGRQQIMLPCTFVKGKTVVPPGKR
ncbi:MAG TPA: LacI family DNA-binding transcriptional regulator [Ktedonobacteraceae bacterium]|nr:LacI family DNA-binding transcriptional regulator [Ktedonobacteraceae bacterium]